MKTFALIAGVGTAAFTLQAATAAKPVVIYIVPGSHCAAFEKALTRGYEDGRDTTSSRGTASGELQETANLNHLASHGASFTRPILLARHSARSRDRAFAVGHALVRCVLAAPREAPSAASNVQESDSAGAPVPSDATELRTTPFPIDEPIQHDPALLAVPESDVASDAPAPAGKSVAAEIEGKALPAADFVRDDVPPRPPVPNDGAADRVAAVEPKPPEERAVTPLAISEPVPRIPASLVREFGFDASFAAPAAKPDVSGAESMNDLSLADVRGGFTSASGANFSFGVQMTTTVNGQLALSTSLTVNAQGSNTSETVGAGALSLSQAQNFGLNLAGLPQNGVLIKGPGGATAIIQNTTGQILNLLINNASGQSIVQDTSFTLYVPNLPALKQEAAINTVGSSVTNAINAAMLQLGGH